MARTTRVDYEIAAAKTDMVRIALLEGVRQCSAVWNEHDIEAIRLIDEISNKIEELYEYFITQS